MYYTPFHVKATPCVVAQLHPTSFHIYPVSQLHLSFSRHTCVISQLHSHEVPASPHVVSQLHRMSGKWPATPPREIWYPPVGGTTGAHRGAGRWPPPKPREPLVNPLDGLPKWKPTKPKPPTQSFNFNTFLNQLQGKSQPKWPQVGGSSGAHRSAGRWPPPGQRGDGGVSVLTPSPVAAPSRSKSPPKDDSGEIPRIHSIPSPGGRRVALFHCVSDKGASGGSVVSWYDSGAIIACILLSH